MTSKASSVPGFEVAKLAQHLAGWIKDKMFAVWFNDAFLAFRRGATNSGTAGLVQMGGPCPIPQTPLQPLP